jgi:hypothetical protein
MLVIQEAAFLCGPWEQGRQTLGRRDDALQIAELRPDLRRESLPEKSERTPAMPALVAGGTSRALTAVERATGLQAAALVDKSNA